jgi:hypothetical protein
MVWTTGAYWLVKKGGNTPEEKSAAFVAGFFASGALEFRIVFWLGQTMISTSAGGTEEVEISTTRGFNENYNRNVTVT